MNRSSAVLGVVVLGLAGSLGISPASAVGKQSPSAAPGGGYFRLASELNGKCLEVRGGNLGNGGAVAMRDCSGYANQAWTAISLGNHAFQFQNGQSGKCLDLQDDNSTNGAGVNQWACADNPAQRWYTFGVGGSEYSFHVGNENGKCLAIADRNPWNGAAVVIEDCFGDLNQYWLIHA
ncbi:RICIN domain-containing protein [Kitasatospora sp. NPDC058218]|uniref:RICIN domain-containing protein n=1 Tax=Kitasatospora sp. NPDC058218 TaxID=3346385 RepID=UPI0036DC0EC8